MFDALTIKSLDRRAKSLGGRISRARVTGAPADDIAAMQRDLTVTRIRLHIVNTLTDAGISLTDAEVALVAATLAGGQVAA